MTLQTKNFVLFSYYLQFEARKLLSVKGDVAIDDIAMSPKCFGLGKHKINSQIFYFNVYILIYSYYCVKLFCSSYYIILII